MVLDTLRSYVGEVGIWTGIWALASTSLQSPSFPRGTVALAAISPLFTYGLLRYVSVVREFRAAPLMSHKVSGVPPLERGGDKKFGSDPKWQEYKRWVLAGLCGD